MKKFSAPADAIKQLMGWRPGVAYRKGKGLTVVGVTVPAKPLSYDTVSPAEARQLRRGDAGFGIAGGETLSKAAPPVPLRAAAPSAPAAPSSPYVPPPPAPPLVVTSGGPPPIWFACSNASQTESEQNLAADRGGEGSAFPSAPPPSSAEKKLK